MNTYYSHRVETTIQGRLSSKWAVVCISALFPLTLLTFFSTGCEDPSVLTPEELGEVVDEPPEIPGASELYVFPTVEELSGASSADLTNADDGSSELITEDEGSAGTESAENEASTNPDDAPIFDLLAPGGDDEESNEDPEPIETE